MNDDVYSRPFLFSEPIYCEIDGCNNNATEIIDIAIPWEHHESGKFYLCHKCLVQNEKKLDDCSISSNSSRDICNFINGDD
jgi:hypothetical protein